MAQEPKGRRIRGSNPGPFGERRICCLWHTAEIYMEEDNNMSFKILVINPGSTSTKIAVYEDENCLYEETLRHKAEELSVFPSVPSQTEFRSEIVIKSLKAHGYSMDEFDAISCRGGALHPIPSGTYAVNEKMVKDCFDCVCGQHASNLGALISDAITKNLNTPIYTVDPTVVDELQPVARYSGHPAFVRASKFHCLNQKAVARRWARENGRRYDEVNVIVCHMGGGNSVGAHRHGLVVDVENALDGEGPFSAERSGTLPIGDMVHACYSGKYTEKEAYSMVVGKGGLVAYTGSNDMRELTNRAKAGDAKIQELLDAYHYQIANEIAARAIPLGGKVDQIILTGGVAYGKETTDAITALVDWIAPVTVYPGEMEMLALAQGVLRVLNGEEKSRVY